MRPLKVPYRSQRAALMIVWGFKKRCARTEKSVGTPFFMKDAQSCIPGMFSFLCPTNFCHFATPSLHVPIQNHPKAPFQLTRLFEKSSKVGFLGIFMRMSVHTYSKTGSNVNNYTAKQYCFTRQTILFHVPNTSV